MSDILKNISALSILVPMITGIICYRHFDKNAGIMFLLIVLASFPQLGSVIFKGNEYTAVRSVLYNLYALADPLIWGLLFFRNIKNARLRKVLIVMPLVQASLWIYLLLTRNIFNGVYSELICLTSVIQVIWITVFFYEQYSSDDKTPIEQKSLFWFCIGLLLYAPTTYFLFVFYNDVTKGDSPIKYLWDIHGVFNVCMYCIISIGFWINRKKKSIIYNAVS